MVQRCGGLSLLVILAAISSEVKGRCSVSHCVPNHAIKVLIDSNALMVWSLVSVPREIHPPNGVSVADLESLRVAESVPAERFIESHPLTKRRLAQALG